MFQQISGTSIIFLSCLFGIIVLFISIVSKINRQKKSGSTTQWRPTPQIAKDVAAHKQALSQQEYNRRKQALAYYYPQELHIIMKAINKAIAEGNIYNNVVHVSVPEIITDTKDSIYCFYKEEMQKDLEKAYIPHGWKSVTIIVTEYGQDQLRLFISLVCD